MPFEKFQLRPVIRYSLKLLERAPLNKGNLPSL